MELEHGERPRLVSGLIAPLLLFLPFAALILLVESWRHPLWSIPLLLLLLAKAAAIGWTARKVLVTDRRVVEYRPGVAWLARRFPRLRGAERRRRRALYLDDLAVARREAGDIVLRDHRGGEHRLHCADVDAAASLFGEIDALLRRGVPPGAIRRPLPGETGGSSRLIVHRVDAACCPYCKDVVEEPDGVACERCGTAHHAECFEIHGQCVVFACGGRRTASLRARTG